MVEWNKIIDQRKITYEGLFNFTDLYKTIDGWFYEKGYDKFEKENYEQVTPTGKQITLDLFPWKKITDYFENDIRLKIKVADLVDVEIEKNGTKIKTQKGRVTIIVDAYQKSDYDIIPRWERKGKPIMHFFRVLMEKYAFSREKNKAKDWLINDTEAIIDLINKYLNAWR